MLQFMRDIWKKSRLWFIMAFIIILLFTPFIILICTLTATKEKKSNTKYTEEKSEIDNIYKETILLIGGLPENCSQNIEVFESKQNRVFPSNWTLLTNRYRHVSGLVAGHVIVTGGHQDWTTANRVNSTEVLYQNWTIFVSGPQLNHMRYLAAGAVLDNKLFVCGGTDEMSNDLKSCEYIDLFSNQSILVSCMEQEKSAAAAVGVDNALYVIGGFNKKRHKDLGTVEKYDITRDSWQFIKPMNYPRSYLAATTLEKNIYVCGGFNQTEHMKICEKYNIQKDTWTLISSMNEKRGQFSLVATHGQIYAIGGWNGDRELDSIEIYSPALNKWSFSNVNLTRGRFAFSAVLV